MDDRILAALETFPAPLILCDEQDFIVFANVRAQGLLLDVDVIDIPILGFIPLWHLCRPAGSQPAKTTVEVFLRNGRYQIMNAVVFKARWDGGMAFGISLLGPYAVF